MISLEFLAIATEHSGWQYGRARSKQYNASFTVDFDPQKVTNEQVNAMVQEQMVLFKKYHPTGQVVQQRQRQY